MGDGPQIKPAGEEIQGCEEASQGEDDVEGGKDQEQPGDEVDHQQCGQLGQVAEGDQGPDAGGLFVHGDGQRDQENDEDGG